MSKIKFKKASPTYHKGVTESDCPCIGISDDGNLIKFIVHSLNGFHFTDSEGCTSNADNPTWVENHYTVAPKGTFFKFTQ